MGKFTVRTTYDVEKTGLSTLAKVIIGACAFALALAIVLIIYVISKKRRKEEAQ